jgi:hypothetical protein
MGTDVRTRKREVLTGLASRLAGTFVHGVPARIRRSPEAVRVTWDFPNGARGMVQVAPIRSEMGAGMFALEPRVTVVGGPLADALTQVTVHAEDPSQEPQYLVSADCRQLGGRRATFTIRPAESDGVEAAHAEITARLIPAIRAFTGDWPAALAIALQAPGALARPAEMAAVLAKWTGRPVEESQVCARQTDAEGGIGD